MRLALLSNYPRGIVAPKHHRISGSMLPSFTRWPINFAKSVWEASFAQWIDAAKATSRMPSFLRSNPILGVLNLVFVAMVVFETYHTFHSHEHHFSYGAIIGIFVVAVLRGIVIGDGNEETE